MAVTGQRRDFGAGPLSRGAALVYTLLVVELLMLLATLPGLVAAVLLERHASNIPLYAACALPLGPALSAALYALHHRSLDLTELRPAAAFLRGYRLNALGALRIWVPWLAWLTVIGVNLANLAAANVPGWWAGLLVAVGIGATLWMVNALVITSLFAFRARDVARLALHALGRTPGVPVGTAGVLALAAGVTALASEAVLALLGSAFALLLLQVCRPMTALVRAEFTA